MSKETLGDVKRKRGDGSVAPLNFYKVYDLGNVTSYALVSLGEAEEPSRAYDAYVWAICPLFHSADLKLLFRGMLDKLAGGKLRISEEMGEWK